MRALAPPPLRVGSRTVLVHAHRVLSSNGADVFKFAVRTDRHRPIGRCCAPLADARAVPQGDAVLALWPPSDEDLATRTRRAAQCALEIKGRLCAIKLSDAVTLSVTVGVGERVCDIPRRRYLQAVTAHAGPAGVGDITVLHVGGVRYVDAPSASGSRTVSCGRGRMEYLPTGTPLVQAFKAEHLAKSPEVVLSPEAWELVSEHFTVHIKDGHAFLQECKDLLRKVGRRRCA